jgi:nucleoside-diphosphate-sugar epimerase
MKKVLLTGASGFIGRQTISPLLNAGYEVHAVSSKELPSISMPGVVWHRVDLMDKQAVSIFMEASTFSHLLHLAWVTTPGKYWISLENLDWVEASLHLVRLFILNGGKRVVVAGTCAEYEWKGEKYCEDRTPFIPSTLYGASKRGLYLILKSLCDQSTSSFAWGYVFFLYGPYENPKRFVPSVIQGLLGQDLIPCSEGSQIRDFMHVSDVANAFVALLESEVIGGVNIASGRGVSLKETALFAAKIIGGEERLQFGVVPIAAHEPKQLVPDVTRLFSEVGWRPKYQFEEGILEAISWWKQGNKTST